MKAYSLELRQQILPACEARLGSQRAIAHLFGVSQSFVEKLVHRRRTTGTMAALPPGGGRQPLGETPILALVRVVVQAQPDATHEALCRRLQAQRGLRLSLPTLSRLLQRLGLPRKQSRFTRPRGRPRGSSRRAPPTDSGARRSTPGACRSSMRRASSWR
jgi:transposase